LKAEENMKAEDLKKYFKKFKNKPNHFLASERLVFFN